MPETFSKPNLSKKEKKEQKELIDSMDKSMNQTHEERQANEKAVIRRNANKFAWWKVSPNTKAMFYLNGALTFILIVITAVTVFQQCSTNKTNKASLVLMQRQDSTNQENLDLMQKEFELNYRPYISVNKIESIINNDTIHFSFQLKNIGNIPGTVGHITVIINNTILRGSLNNNDMILFPNQELITSIYAMTGNLPHEVLLNIPYKDKNDSSFIFYTNYKLKYNPKTHKLEFSGAKAN